MQGADVASANAPVLRGMEVGTMCCTDWAWPVGQVQELGSVRGGEEREREEGTVSMCKIGVEESDSSFAVAAGHCATGSGVRP